MRRRKPKGNYAFIDNQNLNLGIQKMGWKMDWTKFRKYLKDEHDVTHAYMFIGHVPEYEDMYIKLHELGYLIVLKPTFDMTKPLPEQPPESAEGDKPDKPEEKKPIKGNVDAELVLWAVKEMPNYDKAIIVSGDGDFYSLAEYLVEQQKLLHIMTPNWQYSSLLKQFEEYILRLDLQKDKLALTNPKTGRRIRPKGFKPAPRQ